jgi:hypothetical protein
MMLLQRRVGVDDDTAIPKVCSGDSTLPPDVRADVADSLTDFFCNLCVAEYKAGLSKVELKSLANSALMRPEFRLGAMSIRSLVLAVLSLLDLVGVPQPSLPAGKDDQVSPFRARIFALERENVMMQRKVKETEDNATYEQDIQAKRLMEVNEQLQEKLRSRTQDLRKAGGKLIDTQRSIDQTQQVLENKTKELKRAEYSRDLVLQKEQKTDDLRAEYEKRLAVLTFRESRVAQIEKVVIDKLTLIETKPDKLEEWAKAQKKALKKNEADMNLNTVLDQLNDEFQKFLRHRKKVYDENLHTFQSALEAKRVEYDQVSKEIRELRDNYQAERRGLTRSRGVQTREEEIGFLGGGRSQRGSDDEPRKRSTLDPGQERRANRSTTSPSVMITPTGSRAGSRAGTPELQNSPGAGEDFSIGEQLEAERESYIPEAQEQAALATFNEATNRSVIGEIDGVDVYGDRVA